MPKEGSINTASPDTIKAMPPEMLFDYLASASTVPRPPARKLGLNINFTDLKSRYLIPVEHAVMNYAYDKSDPKADGTLTLSKVTLNAVQLTESTLDQKIASGQIKIDGRQEGPRRLSWICAIPSRSGLIS